MLNSGKNIIQNKSFQFSIQIINLYKELKKANEFGIANQLLRCGTSIGANVEEALAGISKKDFIAKMSISSKESRETIYWLRLIIECRLIEYEISEVLQEAKEISKILTSIVKTSQESIIKNS